MSNNRQIKKKKKLDWYRGRENETKKTKGMEKPDGNWIAKVTLPINYW